MLQKAMTILFLFKILQYSYVCRTLEVEGCRADARCTSCDAPHSNVCEMIEILQFPQLIRIRAYESDGSRSTTEGGGGALKCLQRDGISNVLVNDTYAYA